MKKSVLTALAGSLLLLAMTFGLVAACGGGDDGPQTPATCTEDSECGSVLLRCVNNACVTKSCQTTGDCLGTEYCLLKTGAERGTCTVLPSCADDTACPTGFHCVDAMCKSAACQKASDCRKDETCNTSKALCEIVPPVCEEGQTRCRGSILESCKTGGTDTLDWRFVSDCEIGCETVGGVSQCTAAVDGDEEEEAVQVCDPGFTRCNASNAIETCKTDGSAWEVTDPCTQGTCDDSSEPAVCKSKQICDPNGPERKCADDLRSVLICNSAGTGWLTTQCQTLQTCKVQGSGAQCVSSAVCTGNRYRCTANALEKCKSDGSAWQLIENCGSGTCQVSNPVNGEYTQGNCKAAQVCTPITGKRCNGTRAEHCTYDGTGWSLTKDCATTDPVTTCQDGECV